MTRKGASRGARECVFATCDASWKPICAICENAELAKHIFKNHAHTAGSDLCRSWRLASLPLLGLVSYDSAGGGNWTERLPVRFKWSAAA
jgi:hypothetical protein